jgi:hypothetical protein
MNRKFLIIKLAGIFGLILLAVAYIFFYFFPNVEKINRLKREIKLKQETIDETVRDKENFKTFSVGEWLFVEQAEDLFLDKFPVIHSEVDLVRLSSDITEWIKELATTDKIKNLIILSNAEDLNINISPLYTDQNILEELISFTKSKNKEILLMKDKVFSTQISQVVEKASELDTPFGKLAFKTISLGISSDYLKCLGFLNRLSWGKTYLKIVRIEIEQGTVMPKFMIVFRVLYFDKRKRHEK